RFIHESGALLIDETYNANPKATMASVDQLADCNGIKIMVFGNMLDLGEVSDERHRDVGLHAKALGINEFLSFGLSAKLASETFGAGHHFEEKAQLVSWLDDYLKNNRGEPVSVMVKGSRGMKMLDIIQALLGADYKGEA
ncbi:MAG: glutamate ligase domain-containing protein, partial [Endozoicomonas sp.]